MHPQNASPLRDEAQSSPVTENRASIHVASQALSLKQRLHEAQTLASEALGLLSQEGWEGQSPVHEMLSHDLCCLENFYMALCVLTNLVSFINKKASG
jgi:hypothetical protein